MEKLAETDLVLNADGSIYHLGLLPDQVADQIIAVGDQGRVEQISRYFDSVEFKSHKREFITHTGMIGKKRVTVISTGIGPDNVEIFFNEVDALVNIDLTKRVPKAKKRSLNIIRLGTSGAMQKDVPVGTHLVSDYAVGLDNLMNFYRLQMSVEDSSICGALQEHTGLPFKPYMVRGSVSLRKQVGGDMVCGNTITSPGFYAPQGRALRLPIRFPELLKDLNTFRHHGFALTNFEMETATYFAFGKLLGHETTSVNAIIANRMTHEFSQNSLGVVDSLIKKVLERL